MDRPLDLHDRVTAYGVFRSFTSVLGFYRPSIFIIVNFSAIKMFPWTPVSKMWASGVGQGRGTDMGRRAADGGWKVLEAELRAFTARDIVKRLNRQGLMFGRVDDDVARKWQTGGLRPRFAELPTISRGLFDDPFYLARAMGIVPSSEALTAEAFRLHTQIDKLTRQREELDVSLSELRNQAVGRIVTAAAHTKRWAVGVWPAIEGADGYSFHASDRLDFIRTDGLPSSRQDLGQEAELIALLHTAHAVPLLDSSSARPRFRDFMADPETVGYSIPWLCSQFPPSTSHPVGSPTSIAVVSATTRSWARDTAGFIARILGYGLLHTRSLDVQAHGYPITIDERRAHHERMQDSHFRMLKDCPSQYVWSHIGASDPARLFHSPGGADDDESAVVVWVREGDELLNLLLPGHADEYKRARDKIGDLVGNRDRIITVEADLALFDTADRDSWRHTLMMRALKNADTAVDAMASRGLVRSSDVEAAVVKLNSDSRSSIAREIYRWLGDAGRLARGWGSMTESPSSTASS